jgi:hypothetical protein
MPDAKDSAVISSFPSGSPDGSSDTGEPRPGVIGREPAGSPELRLVPDPRPNGPEQLTLDFEWDVAPGVPAVPPVPRGLRLVADDGNALAQADIDGLPDPRTWVARLARAVAEVSVGERPAGQLTRWVARDELARLARRGTHVARNPAMQARRGGSGMRAVRAVRLCPVAPGVIEASAVLVGPRRAQAVALRIEAVGGRWLATAVEVG